MAMPEREPLPEFQEALDRAGRDPEAPQPKCIGDYSFADYSFIPDKGQARSMCVGDGSDEQRCPLFDLCEASALWVRPPWGVQGGIAWVNGRQWHLRRTVDLSPEDEPLEVDSNLRANSA